jgi:hypothetical protein
MPNIDDNMEVIHSLVNKDVVIAITPDGWSRNGFHTQMSVAGTLEMKEDDEGNPAFRVLVNNQTYTYFFPEDVVLATTFPTMPTIFIKIPVE